MSTRDAASRLGRKVRTIDGPRCWELIESVPVGRLVIVDSSATPIALPVNHAVDDGTIVFRTIPGSKLASAVQHHRVSYQVDWFDRDLHSGWSVLAKGRAMMVTDQETLERRHGGRLESWATGVTETFWVRVTPDELTGLELLPDR
jgi:nitroimidazol reductase NimA-like FMN-containing flavoprotein (pyridoxamine 5'-phosphate oxidase superfamily)